MPENAKDKPPNSGVPDMSKQSPWAVFKQVAERLDSSATQAGASTEQRTAEGGVPYVPSATSALNNPRSSVAGNLFVVVVSGGLALWIFWPDSVEERATARDQEFYQRALVQCQSQVEERLKTPGTARFQVTSPQDLLVKIGDDLMGMHSHVDAENSFGALLRTPFTCRWRFDGTGDRQLLSNWQLEEVSFSR